MWPVFVTSGDSLGVPPAPSVSDTLAPGEELVQVRTGEWRLLLPMRFVERVLGAALPAVSPAAGQGGAPPVVAVGKTLVPVLFAAALLGAPEVRLRAEDQMILLRSAERRALLWVEAVEEVLPFDPVPPPPGAARPLVAGFSGRDRPLAVLDIPTLVTLAA